MFTLIRFITGIAVLAFVICTVREVQSKIANHEENPYQMASAASVGAMAMGAVGNLVAKGVATSRDSYGGSGGKAYRGGYVHYQAATEGRGGRKTTMRDDMCGYYTDQCASRE